MRRVAAVGLVVMMTISVGAAWMRWYAGELPPWTSVAFLTGSTALWALALAHDLWSRR